MAELVGLTTTPSRNQGLVTTAASFAVAAIGGALGSLIVASAARSGGVADGFKPLHVGTYVPLVVIAALIGTIGWNLVLRRSRDPRRMLRRLVPAVVLVSFAPDILVGVSDSTPHTTWGAVATLMVMHVVVAAVFVGTFRSMLGAGSPPTAA